MGLDMYLYKRTYIGANYEHRNVHGLIEIDIDGKRIPIKFKRVSYIIEEVGYWRKANHIHRWFVENCQGGVDKCQEANVSKEKLAELLDICERVQKDHSLAPVWLPTQSGCFFGETEYNKYYFEDIKATIRIISEVLREGVDNWDWDASIYYRSSW